MTDVDPFAEFGAKADADDPFAEFGVKADAPAPATPAAATPTPAPAPMSFGEKMTSLGRESAKAAFEPLVDVGRGLISGAPFDLGPRAVAALESVGDKTYEEALAEERAKLAESQARSPFLFGGGELVSEYGTLRGVGKGAAALGKAAGRVAPVAKTAAELAAESAAMGAYGATEAASRGEDVGRAALMTAALPGAGRAAGTVAQFLKPSVEAGLIEKAVRYPLAGAAAVSVPAGLAYASYPTEGTTSDKIKWLVTQGLIGRDVAGQALGAAKGAAARKLEPLQSRAAQEAEGLVRQKVYEPEAQRMAEEARREAKISRSAANMEKQAEKTLRDLQGEAESLVALEKGLEEGTDPSLRGMLGKLFQDTSNRIMGAEEAIARNPGKFSSEFVDRLKATRALVDESYVLNTEKGGYLSDFVDDPYARLEAYRQDKLAEARKTKSANAKAQEEASTRLLTDFRKEAEAEIQASTTPDTATFLKQLTQGRPEQLEPAVQARMAQELAAARRTVSGLSPTTVQPGERPSGILESSTGRILYETLFPEEARPFVSLRRFMPGAGGGAVRVTEPKRSLPEYASVREGEIPTETRLERPLQLQALTDSWLRMLRTEREPRTAIERVARGLGKTVDEFVSTPSLALESLKLALQEHEASKERKSREEEDIRRYLEGVKP